MPRAPFMNFPYPFYRNSRVSPYYRPIAQNMPPTVVEPYTNYKNSEIRNKDEDFNNIKQKNKSNKNNDNYLFDLLGLKIYYDDVLLVSLIYFLYSEGVKDDGLFIVLILLLLS